MLAEIHSNLADLSIEQLNFLANIVIENITKSSEIDEDELKEKLAITKVNEMINPKSAISCIRFLLVSAARHNTDNLVFSTELQQLGLPKEHALEMANVLELHSRGLRDKLADNSLMVNELENVSVTTPENTIECIQLKIDIKNEIIEGISQPSSHIVNLSKSDIPKLLTELKAIQKTMEDLDYESKCKKNVEQ